MMQKFKEYSDFFLVVALMVLVSLASAYFQKPISKNDGKGWDGFYYYEVAEQITNGEPIASYGPFVYRVGASSVASWISPDNLLQGFYISGIIASVLATLLLYVWFRQFFSDWRIRFILMALFILSWNGPVRFAHYYSVHNNFWAHVFTILGLLLIYEIDKKFSYIKLGLLSLVLFVGMFFRETMLFLALSLFFVNNPLPPISEIFPLSWEKTLSLLKKIFRPVLFIPLIAVFLGAFIAHAIATQTNDYSTLNSFFGFGFSRAIFEYILALFIAYGPVIILCAYSWRSLSKFLWSNQYLCVFLLSVLVCAWAGGLDVERYFFAGCAVIYLLLGLAIQENLKVLSWKPLWILLGITQLIAMRVFWTTPDVPSNFSTPIPFLTYWTNEPFYHNLLAVHGKHFYLVIMFGQYLILSGIILYMMHYRSKKIVDKSKSLWG